MLQRPTSLASTKPSHELQSLWPASASEWDAQGTKRLLVRILIVPFWRLPQISALCNLENNLFPGKENIVDLCLQENKSIRNKISFMSCRDVACSTEVRLSGSLLTVLRIVQHYPVLSYLRGKNTERFHWWITQKKNTLSGEINKIMNSVHSGDA